MNKKFVISLIVLVLLLVVEGVLWWEREGKEGGEKGEEKITEKKETILTPEIIEGQERFVEIMESEEMEDQKNLPEGIEVIKTEDKKIIKNTAKGFQIEASLNFILKECFDASGFTLYDIDSYKEMIEDGYPSYKVESIYIHVDGNPKNYSLKEYLDNWYVEIEGIPSPEIEKTTFIGEEAYRVKSKGGKGLSHVSYYILNRKNNKIYSISIPLADPEDLHHKEYQDIINTFKFLE